MQESTTTPISEGGFVVIFGGSGDLAHRKLLPALARLRQQGMLSDKVVVVGVGRSDLTDETFRERAAPEIRDRVYFCRAGYDEEGVQVLPQSVPPELIEDQLPADLELLAWRRQLDVHPAQHESRAAECQLVTGPGRLA